jgi:hypothetical protein
MLFSNEEAIARFLPPAKWTMPDRARRGPGGADDASPHVAYTIPDDIIKTASPLTTLPRSEIDSFTTAVSAFLAKARPEAQGVPPYMKQCRQEFRLPDPDLDPAAYWVYGSEFDRHLLVLWGCEPQAGLSLTLDQAVAKLRNREMAWPDKQALGLKLALRPGEALSRFLAPRSANGGLVVGGMTVPTKKLKRLRHITPGEWAAFDAAAKAYYAKAHPTVSNVSEFEKELRREFRLPAPDLVPGDFYTFSSRLVIALDTWPRERTLPATDDPLLKLAEPPATDPVVMAAPSPPTVAAQLKSREVPGFVRTFKLAGSAAAVLALGLGVWWLWPDHVPPALLEGDAGVTLVDDHTVVLNFSKKLMLESLRPKPAPAQPAVQFLDDKLKIARTALIPGDESHVRVQTEEPMHDGEPYQIAVQQVTDPHGNALVYSKASFTYLDREVPKLGTISAGGPGKRNLLLVFSKPILEASVSPSRFAIFPMNAGQPGKKLGLADAKLDPQDKTGRTVLIEANEDFVGNDAYQLSVTGVTDRAQKPNLADISAKDFRYVDVLPPRLLELVATGDRFELRLEFSKPVDPVLAQDESNYSLTGPDKTPVKLLKGAIRLDANSVILPLAPTRLDSGQFRLVIASLADRQGNKISAPIDHPFKFSDDNTHPPVLQKVEGVPNLPATSTDRSLRLVFDRTLAPGVDFTPDHYQVLLKDRRPSGSTVQTAQAVADDPTRIRLDLSRPLAPGQYFLETNGLANVFGNIQDTPAPTSFTVSGAIIIPSYIDWAAPPRLAAGGRSLVLVLTDRVTKASAAITTNYVLTPALPITSAEITQPGTEDNPQTTITLHLATPATGPETVNVNNLIIESQPSLGPQTLRANQTQP